jgi:hypothetical protein
LKTLNVFYCKYCKYGTGQDKHINESLQLGIDNFAVQLPTGDSGHNRRQIQEIGSKIIINLYRNYLLNTGHFIVRRGVEKIYNFRGA